MRATAPATSGLPTAFGAEIVTAACRAPSIHNTQPWWWRVVGSSIELYADPSRRLARADPSGRNLAISVGAALHHAQVAARGLGWHPDVVRWPEGPESDLVARISLTPSTRSSEDVALLRALHERRTDRRRFTSWPVQGTRLESLAQVAEAWGAEAVVLDDIVDRFRVEHLVSRAHATQVADAGLREEHRRWTEHSVDDGVPVAVVPTGEGEAASRLPRFSGGQLTDPGLEVETTDGVVVLCSDSESRTAWTRSGEALGAMWLHAVRDGLAVVPLSQVIEVDDTRSSLQHQVLLGLAFPHLVLRVGWLPIARDQLPATPRRPVDDVLRP